MTNLADTIIGKLDKIPIGSKFDSLNQELFVLFKKFDGDKFEDFLKEEFQDCFKFMLKEKLAVPSIRLLLIYNSDQYQQIERETDKLVISKEVAKGPSTAFVTNIGVIPTMHINVGALFECIKSGFPTFILNLVNTYFHEMLHTCFPLKTEQQIFDLECVIVEKYLGVELPSEFKSLKSSDYYLGDTSSPSSE